MPQGEGTYGNQVGRPSNKRTSFVNDNNWWSKLTSYDFGQSRKEKYVGPGTGSMITTPSSRRGYAKDGSPRMKIEERDRTGEARWRRYSKKWDIFASKNDRKLR